MLWDPGAGDRPYRPPLLLWLLPVVEPRHTASAGGHTSTGVAQACDSPDIYAGAASRRAAAGQPLTEGGAMASGTIERKCMKGHNKADGRCSARCVRWYPRIQRATPDGHGRRRFDYLGGYPTKAAAQSALDQAL